MGCEIVECPYGVPERDDKSGGVNANSRDEGDFQSCDRIRSSTGQQNLFPQRPAKVSNMDEDAASHNTRESEEAAKRGLRFLQIGFRRLDAIEARIAALAVRDHSSLDGDRTALPYNPISDQVQALLATATDHLRAVQVTVEDSGGKILAMSLFTLVRTAYEAAGTGLWLLHPSSRDKRLLRSMQLTWDNRRQVRSVGTELGKAPADDLGFQRMESRLNELRMAREGLRQEKLSGLESVTSRLRSIGTLVPGLVFPPVVLWQLASGIAHGNSSMVQSFLEKEQLTPFTNGSADFKLTSSVVSVAMFYDAALTVVERLIDKYESRNIAPDIGHRPPQARLAP
jgi:hypothetical protein